MWFILIRFSCDKIIWIIRLTSCRLCSCYNFSDLAIFTSHSPVWPMITFHGLPVANKTKPNSNDSGRPNSIPTARFGPVKPKRTTISCLPPWNPGRRTRRRGEGFWPELGRRRQQRASFQIGRRRRERAHEANQSLDGWCEKKGSSGVVREPAPAAPQAGWRWFHLPPVQPYPRVSTKLGSSSR